VEYGVWSIEHGVWSIGHEPWSMEHSRLGIEVSAGTCCWDQYASGYLLPSASVDGM